MGSTRKKGEIQIGKLYSQYSKYYIAGPDGKYWSWSTPYGRWRASVSTRKFKAVVPKRGTELSCKVQAELLKVTKEQFNLLSEQVFNPADTFTAEEMAAKELLECRSAKKRHPSSRLASI
tara:strand:- start:1607 stop:1966 length:360 start_codon:yes stop_codon:yes gene_type:complete